MMFRSVIYFAFLGIVYSCKTEVHLSKIEGHKRLSITDSLQSNARIDAFIAPYRTHVNSDLDSVLAYAKATYSPKDGELNTAIGNFMADAVLELSRPIFKSRTGQTIDMALLNRGGIRSPISKGNITSRTAYRVMPFENSVVVVPISGKRIQDMLHYLATAKRAHPIANMQLTLHKNYSIKDAKIANTPIDTSQTYYIATNDYLYKGGNGMNFLMSKDTVYDLNYKVRNVLIDYFKQIDTLQPTIDNRFIRLD